MKPQGKVQGAAGQTPQGQKATAKAQSAPFKISTPESRKRHLNLMVYGEYGCGKTYLAGTSVDVPNMRDVLVIDAEKGSLTLDDPDHDFHDIDAVPVDNYNQVARVQEFLKEHCKYRDVETEEAKQKLCNLEGMVKGEEITEPRRYRTVIIDSLKEVEDMCMYQLSGVRDSIKLDEEIPVAGWDEFRRNLGMVQRLIRSFRDLPMHVIFTCPSAFIQDENKRQIFAPQLTGQLAKRAQGFMDMVGYLVQAQKADEEGNISRRLYVAPTGKFAAKCRFSTFKHAYFDEPDMPKIIKAIGLEK